jgi:hypothetical protein
MILSLTRRTFTDISTIGDLAINGDFFSYTLEDVVREIENQPVDRWKIAGKTAIPKGLYELTLDYSTRFDRIMPHILNVQGFSGVRIHNGSYAKDTEGCPLVGFKKGIDFIGDSKKAFNALMEKLLLAYSDGEKMTIQIQ